MSTRITTAMVQRNVLSDLNRSPTSSRQHAGQGRLGQGDHRPSDDPFGAAQAMGLRQEQSAPTQQYQRNVQDARAGRTRPRPRCRA